MDNVETAEDMTKTTTATEDYEQHHNNESQRNAAEDGIDSFYKVQFQKEAD